MVEERDDRRKRNEEEEVGKDLVRIGSYLTNRIVGNWSIERQWREEMIELKITGNCIEPLVDSGTTHSIVLHLLNSKT